MKIIKTLIKKQKFKKKALKKEINVRMKFKYLCGLSYPLQNGFIYFFKLHFKLPVSFNIK